MTTYSYCTPGDVEEELRAENSFSSSTYPSLSTVQEWIQQESDIINDMTNSVYSSQTVTEEVYDYNGDDEYIMPSKLPLISLTTLEYNDANEGETPNWVTKTEDTDYYVYEDRGTIEFIYSNFAPKPGKRRLRLTYNYGTSVVPSRVKKLTTLIVTLRVIESLYNKNVNEGDVGGTTSVGVVNIVEPDNLGLNIVKNIQERISDYKGELKGGTHPIIYR